MILLDEIKANFLTTMEYIAQRNGQQANENMSNVFQAIYYTSYEIANY